MSSALTLLKEKENQFFMDEYYELDVTFTSNNYLTHYYLITIRNNGLQLITSMNNCE